MRSECLIYASEARERQDPLSVQGLGQPTLSRQTYCTWLLPDSPMGIEAWKNGVVEHALFADRLVKQRARQEEGVEGKAAKEGEALPLTPAVAKHLIYLREGSMLVQAGKVIKSSGIGGGLGKEDSRLLLLIRDRAAGASLIYLDEEAKEVKAPS